MNILITSCGRRAYLIEYFKEALKKEGVCGLVHASNATEFTPCASVADRFVKTPLIYEAGYIDFLIDYCKENDIKAVISLFDIDLPVLAKNKPRFEAEGITVVVSSPEFVEICNDKLLTCEFLKKNGIDTPRCFLSPKEAKEAIASGLISFPLVIKPRRGMGSLSMYFADNEAELDVFFKKVSRDIQKSYLKYEAALTDGREVIIQELAKGEEYGLDVISDINGKYVTTLVKKKIAMRAGETDSATVIDCPFLKNLGEKLASAPGQIGVLDADVFYDKKTGSISVIEMNARFGGGYPFSHFAGADVPRAIVCWLLGKAAEEELFKVKYGMSAQKDIRITGIGASNE